MTDIYEKINSQAKIEIEESDPENADRIEERNKFPDFVPPEKDLSFPHDRLSTRIDFFQEHPAKIEFNENNGLLSLYDPNSLDRQYMDIIEQEAIMLSSPPIKYYRLRHMDNDVDPLYGEAKRRDAFCEPVIIYGNYEDTSFTQELTKFGINQQETIDIWFNLNYLLNKIGGIIQKGDILETYDSKLWEVMTSIVIDESLWRAQHNNVKAIRVQPQGIFLPDYDGKYKSSVHNIEGLVVSPEETDEYEFESEKDADEFKRKLEKIKKTRIEGI